MIRSSSSACRPVWLYFLLACCIEDGAALQTSARLPLLTNSATSFQGFNGDRGVYRTTKNHRVRDRRMGSLSMGFTTSLDYYHDLSRPNNEEREIKIQWISHLDMTFNRAPADLCRAVENEGETIKNDTSVRPRMAKSVEYAKSVQKAWLEEIKDNGTNVDSVQCAPVVYQDAFGTPLYGHLVYNKAAIEAAASTDAVNRKRLQGNVLFHTGAGPQDIFLHWKAYSLVTQRNKKGDISPCVVFIADMISDPTGAVGWGDDRSEYSSARDHLLQVKTTSSPANNEEQNLAASAETSPSTTNTRPVLHSRVQAAINTLKQPLAMENGNLLQIFPDQISVMGWCFGGHPVLEIVRCEDLRRQIKCAVTFHGVIDGIQDLEFDNVTTDTSKSGESHCSSGEEIQRLRLLICHGREDPFIKREHMQLYHTMLDALSAPPAPKVQWSMLQFGGVRHGFSNPAQEFNPNQKTFGYDATAARVAWDTALSILH